MTLRLGHDIFQCALVFIGSKLTIQCATKAAEMLSKKKKKLLRFTGKKKTAKINTKLVSTKSEG